MSRRRRPHFSKSESEMMRIWRQVLKIEDLNVDSNFFDLGGHSLLLARLQIVLEARVQCSVDGGGSFPASDDRNPGGMAGSRQIGRERSRSVKALTAPAEQNPRIIPIQPLGTGRPIFVISQSMIFRTLAAELGTEQPVFAIQTLEQDNAAMASANYEQLIDFYVRLIREVAAIGTLSTGGLVLSAGLPMEWRAVWNKWDSKLNCS